jgi:thiamine pyrophosphokinase
MNQSFDPNEWRGTNLASRAEPTIFSNAIWPSNMWLGDSDSLSSRAVQAYRNSKKDIQSVDIIDKDIISDFSDH